MPDAEEPELPRAIALAWGVAAEPQRGPKREMSVERIVEAAVEIADGEGLGAVSMSAVAAKLGYTPMSLYRYVTAKDDLILLMQEEATGLPSEEARLAGDWRAQLTALYTEQVQAYLRHPWVLDIPISGTPTTPRSSAWMDAGLQALAGTPLSHADRLAVLLIVTGHARWAGIVLAGYMRTAREQGVGDEGITRREDALYRTLITADAYPALRAAIDAGVFLDESDPFRFGLERSLDGVALYMDAASHRGPAATDEWVVLDDADIAHDKKYREAQRSISAAEKALRDARRTARQVAREARDRAARQRGGA